jgi:hypothetical protein
MMSVRAPALDEQRSAYYKTQQLALHVLCMLRHADAKGEAIYITSHRNDKQIPKEFSIFSCLILKAMFCMDSSSWSRATSHGRKA